MDWHGRAFYTVGIICCLFFVVPIKIRKQPKADELLFKSFIESYNKSYLNNETEYWKRYEHFQNSLKLIDQLNSNGTKTSAKYGITKFCDLSPEEFEMKHLQRVFRKEPRHKSDRRKRAPIMGIPVNYDWRQKGVITPVRNQLLCGACWAFSTVETVETMNALKNRTLKELSVQQVIDCAANGNNGCNGGDSRLLLEWLVTNKIKIEPETEYPYIQRQNTCLYKPQAGSVQVSSFSCKNMIGGEEAILESLFTHGPVVVAVNAANWQFYLGGVIQFHCPGESFKLNHAVQLVGYVNSGPSPHFIARNSWGTSFGNKGYVYLKIGSNICGLANEVCMLDIL